MKINLDTLREHGVHFPDAVHTPWDGRGPFYAYVQGYDSDSDQLIVRLELPDDDPAMLDAVADTGIHPDQVEIVVYVPRKEAVDADFSDWSHHGEPVPDPRGRLATAARKAQRERIKGELLSGDRPRLKFPDLDSGLRRY